MEYISPENIQGSYGVVEVEETQVEKAQEEPICYNKMRQAIGFVEIVENQLRILNGENIKESLGLIAVAKTQIENPVKVAHIIGKTIDNIHTITEGGRGNIEGGRGKKDILGEINKLLLFANGENPKIINGCAFSGVKDISTRSNLYWKDIIIGKIREYKMAQHIAGKNTLTKAEIQKLLGIYLSQNRKELRGRKGYLFVSRYFYGGNMQKAFIQMSALCKEIGKDFAELQWGKSILMYVSDFEKAQTELITHWEQYTQEYNPETNNTYAFGGINGYKKFATRGCSGNMQKAFIQMSALCHASGKDFKKLNWGKQLQMSVTELEKLY